LGEVHLEPSKGELKLHATDIPGKSVMDLRRYPHLEVNMLPILRRSG
jgi:hypothetical protein